MKSYKFFLVVAAAAAFTACSSDEGIKSSPQNSGEAMTFAVKNKNLSRAGVVGLETVSKDFGVWAYKTDGTDDAVKNSTTPVMANYIVGYIDNTNANAVGSWPIPPGVTTTYDSPWLYELFTNNENNTQYLKYWDYSQKHYFFYGYAPYVMSPHAPTFDNGTLTLDFGNAPLEAGVAGAADTYGFMYACARVDNSAFGQYVRMDFKRLFAQTQIGYYEDIPGYKVQILSTYKIPTTMGASAEAYYNAAGDFGTVAYAIEKGTDVDDTGNTINTYTLKDYVYSVVPSVEFTESTTDALTGAVTYDAASAKHTTNPFGWVAPKSTDNNGKPVYIGETAGDAAMSPTTYNVVPVSKLTGEVVSYRAFVSYKLIAEDTGEEIIVYNAPVYIDASYANWEPNKLYKYIFKITKGSGGTTSGPEDPDPQIEDTQALFPIVFNNLTVTDLENGGTTEFNISN